MTGDNVGRWIFNLDKRSLKLKIKIILKQINESEQNVPLKPYEPRAKMGGHLIKRIF